jgi:hypothetical protein
VISTSQIVVCRLENDIFHSILDFSKMNEFVIIIH